MFNTGRLLSEPLAEVTVPGAVLAFLWALEQRSRWAWLGAGRADRASALVRPEYLLFGLAFALLALIKRRHRRARVVLAAAFALPIAPWAIHVSREEGRFVPVTTGAGKALFIGSYLPGDGIHDRVKIKLMERYLGMRDVTPEQRARQPMEPLLDRVAARYPDLPRDAALNRIGRENLQPLHARAAGCAWPDDGRQDALDVARLERRDAVGRPRSRSQIADRRASASPALVILAHPAALRGAPARRADPRLRPSFSGVVLAAPRRNLALMPLVMTLASTAAGHRPDRLRPHARSRRRGLQPRLDP